VIQAPRLEGKKVIIAEDDPYSLEMIKYMLRDTGITMLIARDGNKVLELFDSGPVDLLLLDIRMPGKDGFEIVREIRKKNPDIPVPENCPVRLCHARSDQ
jgi:DNA-binding response OmpR family regulator